MKYTKFYTTTLLAVMVLNICKYQMPYIEYNLSHDYIVENLCIQKNEADNCCQGRCYLEKQLSRVNETDENTAAGQTKTKQVKCEISDGIKTSIFSPIPIPFIQTKQSQWVIVSLIRVFIDIPVPPPQRFC